MLFLVVLSTAVIVLAGCSEETSGNYSGIDVDFTEFGMTMAMGKFFEVFTNSSEYLDQIMRVRGEYFSMFFQETGQRHHFITLIPGDDCCRMGFEFMVSGEKSFPEDFPAEGMVIEITGVLSVYEEFGSHFIYLATDEIVIVD